MSVCVCVHVCVVCVCVHVYMHVCLVLGMSLGWSRLCVCMASSEEGRRPACLYRTAASYCISDYTLCDLCTLVMYIYVHVDVDIRDIYI